MDYKKVVVESEREHDEDEYMHKILIAAATTLAMACLKRILVLCFIEQWRSRVFLVLNLLLFAIVFTSGNIRSTRNVQENSDKSQVKIQEIKKPRKECQKLSKIRAKEAHGDVEQPKNIEVDCEEQNKLLSKEELNERVEAFIVMFRQHLVSDARNSRIQSEKIFNVQNKGSNLTS
ncbi:uncharacterized protein LOC126671968 [Mercurialis annua]|uniref:uncharacterized protein LOC126671968 n=1 Tax=Mercurialis annua TaxID=3986 RepID=UPI00215F628F|nr:uncharacterized protein LOC126671968 [Mercurialis annua]